MSLYADCDFCPETTLKKTVVVFVVLFRDSNFARIKVLQGRPMTSVFFDIIDVDFVDESILTLGSHFGLGRVGLVGTNVVVTKRV
jgi:hypothetical protein